MDGFCTFKRRFSLFRPGSFSPGIVLWVIGTLMVAASCGGPQKRPVSKTETAYLLRFDKECKYGNPRICLSNLSKAPKSFRDSPRLMALRNTAGRRHHEACLLGEQSTVAFAQKAKECIDSLRPQVDTPAYEARVKKSDAKLADLLIVRAQNVPSQSPGAKLVLLRTAAALSDDDGIQKEIAVATKQFRTFAPLQISTIASLGETPSRIKNTRTGLPPRSSATSRARSKRICSEIANEAKGRVQCQTKDPALTLHLYIEDIEKSEATTAYSKEYTTAGKRRRNPRYQAAIERQKAAEAFLVRLGPTLRKSKVECARTKKPSACNTYSKAERGRRDAEADLLRIRWKLRDLPEFVTGENQQTHSWEQTTTTWTLPYSYTLAKTDAPSSSAASATAISPRGARLDGRDTVKVVRKSQPGFAPAGVEAMRLKRLTRRQLETEAEVQIVAAIAKKVDAALEDEASAREKDCPRPKSGSNPVFAKEADSDWLQCRAEVEFLRGRFQP